MDPLSDPDNALVNQEMLCCPETSLSNTMSHTPITPINFVLTKFHALLLYGDHVKGISLLNQELIFEDIYNDVCVSDFLKGNWFFFFLIIYLLMY